MSYNYICDQCHKFCKERVEIIIGANFCPSCAGKEVSHLRGELTEVKHALTELEKERDQYHEEVEHQKEMTKGFQDMLVDYHDSIELIHEELEEVKATCKAVSKVHDIEWEHNEKLAKELEESRAEIEKWKTGLRDHMAENKAYIEQQDAVIKVLAHRIAELNRRLHLPKADLEEYMQSEIKQAEQHVKEQLPCTYCNGTTYHKMSCERPKE